jgi:hypothetical protein
MQVTSRLRVRNGRGAGSVRTRLLRADDGEVLVDDGRWSVAGSFGVETSCERAHRRLSNRGRTMRRCRAARRAGCHGLPPAVVVLPQAGAGERQRTTPAHAGHSPARRSAQPEYEAEEHRGIPRCLRLVSSVRVAPHCCGPSGADTSVATDGRPRLDTMASSRGPAAAGAVGRRSTSGTPKRLRLFDSDRCRRNGWTSCRGH